MLGCGCNSSVVGGRERKTTETHWPASLTKKMASSRFSERLSPVNKTKSHGAGQNFGFCIHVHGCMQPPFPHAHIYHMYTYKYIFKIKQAFHKPGLLSNSRAEPRWGQGVKKMETETGCLSTWQRLLGTSQQVR